MHACMQEFGEVKFGKEPSMGGEFRATLININVFSTRRKPTYLALHTDQAYWNRMVAEEIQPLEFLLFNHAKGYYTNYFWVNPI